LKKVKFCVAPIHPPLVALKIHFTWLLECEDIFNLVKIPQQNRVQWGIAHIRGQAKTWLSSSGFHVQHMTWSDLSSILIEHFPDTTSSDPMDLLQQLKQLSSVNAYIDSYEAWMTQMKRERTYLVQEFFVDRFISGLKEGIKHHVQCQKPDSLLSAYWYARQYEKAYLSANKRILAPALAPRQQANIPD
jgi:hypothetical protein